MTEERARKALIENAWNIEKTGKALGFPRCGFRYWLVTKAPELLEERTEVLADAKRKKIKGYKNVIEMAQGDLTAAARYWKGSPYVSNFKVSLAKAAPELLVYAKRLRGEARVGAPEADYKDAIERTQGNLKTAAELLGCPYRSFYTGLQRHDPALLVYAKKLRKEKHGPDYLS